MRRKVRRNRTAKPFVLAAPIGGLNGRDPLTNMPPEDAVELENWVCDATNVYTRPGITRKAYLTGFPVESLQVCSDNVQDSLLIFGNGSIYWLPYSYVEGGTVGPHDLITSFVALATGRTSDDVTGTSFSNAGQQFFFGVSGADTPFTYHNSGNYTARTITGISTPNEIYGAHAFKGRLYLSHPDFMGFHYLAVGAVAGAASFYDMGPLSVRGGVTQGIASFSADSGSGMQDFLVVMSTRGEYFVFEGTDPASASTWRLAGRYFHSEPFGRRGWFNYRSDLYIITREGVVSFREIMASGSDSRGETNITYKLGTFLSDYNGYVDTPGWDAVEWPSKNLLLLNVPASSSITGDYIQYVMNTDTGAWSKFTGLDALCWVRFKETILFGRNDGNIYKLDPAALDDAGTDIVANARQAYNYMNGGGETPFVDKHIHFGTYTFSNSVSTPTIQTVIDTTLAGGAVSDSGVLTAAGLQTLTVPYGVTGNLVSPRVQITLGGTTGPVGWYSTRFTFSITENLVL